LEFGALGVGVLNDDVSGVELLAFLFEVDGNFSGRLVCELRA